MHNKAVKLSIFMMPLHPPGRNYVETLAEDREAVLLADALGYAEAFIGEHVTDIAETVTSSLMFCASLAHETKQIKLGSGTVNMPNNHPAQVAAQVAMLDTMLQGRFLFGISPGGLRSDAEVFGNLEADRTAMFVEAIDQVLEIWRSDAPYDIKGQFWEISTARTLDREIGQGVMLKPYQKPHPPIVITSMSPYSSSVTRAGERGWSIISANFYNRNGSPPIGRSMSKAARRPVVRREPAIGASRKASSSRMMKKRPRRPARAPTDPTGSITKTSCANSSATGGPNFLRRTPTCRTKQ